MEFIRKIILVYYLNIMSIHLIKKVKHYALNKRKKKDLRKKV